jgi:Type I phosphodiesterase / nucleotide pyrophosphatase
MLLRSRQLSLLIVLGIVTLPAVGLRALCVGDTCGSEPERATSVPFCSLPAALRADISAGSYDGRSADVLAVPEEPIVRGGIDGERGVAPAWPTVEGTPSMSVPLLFSGVGVRASAEVPDGTMLSSVAPTLGALIGLRWRNPGVHPGTALEGIGAARPPRLALEVAWKGIGAEDLAEHRGAWPFLRSLFATGAGTTEASAGSLPLDPAAALTSIGTGGLPSDHGITGLYLRNDATGRIARAWGDGSPLSVISALGDDLDEARGGRPLIGLVGTDPSDRGIIGGGWYEGRDDDATAFVEPSAQVDSVEELLSDGFGADDETDLLAVVMRDSISRMDEDLRRMVRAAERATRGDVAIVVAGTGSTANGARDAVPLTRVLGPVESAIPGDASALEAVVAGGLFLDQDVLAQANLTSNAAVTALRGETAPDGRPLMADAFPSFAISFGRYCGRVAT